MLIVHFLLENGFLVKFLAPHGAVGCENEGEAFEIINTLAAVLGSVSQEYFAPLEASRREYLDAAMAPKIQFILGIE